MYLTLITSLVDRAVVWWTGCSDFWRVVKKLRFTDTSRTVRVTRLGLGSARETRAKQLHDPPTANLGLGLGLGLGLESAETRAKQLPT